MADVFTRAKRSEVMSRIRGRNNKSTELELIRIFRASSITGWRRNQPLFGKPDFVFRVSRVAVFVDGCFWHGCPIHCNSPATNSEFWSKKLNANIKRDLSVTRTLRQKEWRVIRIWEHELSKKNQGRLVSRIKRVLKIEKE